MRVMWGCLAMVVIAPLAGLFFLVMAPVWRDDARLDDFHERVLAYPLPPETRNWSDSDATFGKLDNANGDYCEYRVRLTLWTGLSEKEIRAYYAKAVIAGVDNETQAEAVTLYLAEDSGDDRAVIAEFRDLSPSDWDWRCA